MLATFPPMLLPIICAGGVSAVDTVFALMHLNAHEDAYGWRAWKSFPWEATDGLHERGLIDDPR